MSDGVSVHLPHGRVEDHAALDAWRALHRWPIMPTTITTLRETGKSSVYRLADPAHDGYAVIAKRCSPETALIERTIYERVLPQLGLTTLQYHGHIVVGDTAWLFLEDAGDIRLSPVDPEHRALATDWLALMHTSAARAAPAFQLPDRGPAYYLEKLRATRETIRRSLANIALRTSDRKMLGAIINLCEALEARWSELAACCAATPATLVHGDFRPKNVRVRAKGNSAELCVLDWETSGWGTPAADLASARGYPVELIDVRTYCSVVRATWTTLTDNAIRQLVRVGRVFRQIAAISWDAQRLSSRWPQKPMQAMHVYRRELASWVQ